MEYNLGLFDMKNQTIRTISITKNEYDFLIQQWENPLKSAVAIGERTEDQSV